MRLVDHLRRYLAPALEASDALVEARDALEHMVIQFGNANDRGELHTGGLSALEAAFDALGWNDPHPLPASYLCERAGCSRRSTCGTPTPEGYKRLCYEHCAAIDAARKRDE